VSIEQAHQGGSFGAIPIAIDEKLNVFEAILSVRPAQPRPLQVCPCFLQSPGRLLVDSALNSANDSGN
jgi:hypothetical protein